MKIEIDTAEMLGDEATIRDEVIAVIAASIKRETKQVADKIIQDTLKTALVDEVKNRVAEIVATHIDTEFEEGGEWGAKRQKTTVRDKIAVILQAQCVFKDTNYSSDQNVFTRTVKAVIEAELKRFQKEFNSAVNKDLIRLCMDEATKKLKEACCVK